MPTTDPFVEQQTLNGWFKYNRIKDRIVYERVMGFGALEPLQAAQVAEELWKRLMHWIPGPSRCLVFYDSETRLLRVAVTEHEHIRFAERIEDIAWTINTMAYALLGSKNQPCER